MLRKIAMFLTLLGALRVDCAEYEPTASGNQAVQASAAASHEGAVRLSPSSSALVGLEVSEAQIQGVRSSLRAMGKILACRPQTAIVSHAFPARVAGIHVGIGDWVEKGQALITLESQDVGNAMSEYYKATASFDLAKLNLDRERSLLADGVGARKNLVAAEGDYRIAQANVEAGRVRIKPSQIKPTPNGEKGLVELSLSIK